MHHHPTTNDTALLDAWQRYKDGLGTFEDVQAAQDALMPRCAAHDTPTGVTFAAIVERRRVLFPVCPRCLEDAKQSRAMFIASQRLIAGGIWLREDV